MVIPDCAGYLTMNPVDIYHQIAIHFIRSYGKRVTRTLYAHVDMCPGGIPNMLRYPREGAGVCYYMYIHVLSTGTHTHLQSMVK